MNPLQQIPAKVRAWAYWLSYTLGIALGSVSAAWAVVAATTSAEMPLWLGIATTVVLFLQAQLSQIAGVNVTPDRAPTQATAPLVAQPDKPRRSPPPRKRTETK